MEKYTRIMDAIKEQGETATSTAKKMGIAKSTFSKIVNRDPKISTLAKIAAALGIKTSELVK